MFSNKNKKTIKFHKNSFIHKLQYLLLIFTLLILFFITQAYSYSETISTSLDSKILRLHIVANSNSYQDQIFKLKCRDAIINYLNTNISPSNYTKEYITSFLSNNINNIYEICDQLALQENLNLSFNIKLSKEYFPTKQYSNILLPSGIYDSLKIEIGKTKGNNWWCSLYPPLCFTESSTLISETESLSNLNSISSSTLSNEEINLISKSNINTDIKLKFKIIELFNSFYNK
jgi:stage II sporulation protein R